MSVRMKVVEQEGSRAEAQGQCDQCAAQGELGKEGQMQAMRAQSPCTWDLADLYSEFVS